MKFTSLFTAVGIAAAATATPAAAQVQGNIAIINSGRVITDSQAFGAAFTQIGTTYQAQRTTIQQRQQQIQTLLQQLDTNNDGNLDENERLAAQTAPQTQQIAQIEQEIAGLQNQIDRAGLYAIDEVIKQYGPALQQVVTQNNIQLVLSPDAVAWAPTAANITPQVLAAVNASAPTVQITPPADWQPTQQAVSIYRQLAQVAAAAQQAQMRQQLRDQQQQQPQPQNSGDTRY